MEENIGPRITAARKAAKLRREDLAAVTGLSYGAIRAIETGKHSPTLDSLRRICIAVGISLAELFADNVRSEVALLLPLRVIA